MLIPGLTAGFLVVLVIFMLILSRGFQNPKVPASRTPAEFGLAFEEVWIPTQNNRKLYGWWLPSGVKPPATTPTIVLVHGWGRNVERVLPYIQALYPEGYNLIAFDSRHHGRSDRDKFSSMVKFAEDISATIDLVEKEKGSKGVPIGVVGLSIGGAAAIYAAAQDSRIRAVISVGAFAHPGDLMRWQLQQRGIPYFPLIWLLFAYIQVRIGKRFSEIAPEVQIKRSQAAFLLIHGEQDRVVPLAHGRRLHQAGASKRVQFWVVPEKGHSDCHQHPQFWPRVKAFFREQLAGEAVETAE